MENLKSRKINLMMNELTKDKNDPTKVNFSMIILDSATSHNNVEVGDNGMQSLARSVKGMPIVAKLIKDESNRSNDDFGDHEVKLESNRRGEDVIGRDTIAIGAFTDEGYIVKKEVEGQEVDVLMGNGVLWASRYPDIVELIEEMYNEGIKINTSSEYLYGNYEFNEQGVEIHNGNLYFEGIAVLGSKDNFVAPAYDSATFTMLNAEKADKFNLLVAQALEKEEGEEEQVGQLFNKLSYREMKYEAENQIQSYLNEYADVDVEDITATEIIAEAEMPDGRKEYLAFKYTEMDNKLVVDLESKRVIPFDEIRRQRPERQRDNRPMRNEVETEELTIKVNELSARLNELTTGKEELVSKLSEANEVIGQLNGKVEELTALNAELLPYKEQVETSLKEEKLSQLNEEFKVKFEKVDGAETFNSDEVKRRIAELIEEGETGLNARLALNEMLVELASAKLEKTASPLDNMLNSAKKRDLSHLISTPKEDELLKDLM